ncbi:MAG: alpha-amylase family glycosyl hydrolase [Anaerolineae bacterium]|nr:alpha-amylase family glycosyl hydrolase [Anaerolineae bacterium]
MLKRLPLVLLISAAVLCSCDSSDTIATVTARAEGTQRVAPTLTAALQVTLTRTPTPTVTPSRTPTPSPTPEPTTPVPTESPTPEPTASPMAEPTAPATGLRGTINRTTAARSQPSLAAPELARLEAGQAVSATARSRRFAQITLPDGQTAWILSAHADWQGDLAALPEVQFAAEATPLGSPEFDPLPVRKPETAWFGESVIYSLFVRSFRDSDGDGIGDLRGVIEGLDYIQSLGANTIWLLPIFSSPSYHGYDVTDYYTINPDYGTRDDFLALVQAVRQRGMYLLIDYVANHTSNQHPFFRDALGRPQSQYAEFYIWNNPEHTRYQAFAGIGFMPELNYDSPRVREYMINVALHWLDPNGDGDPSDGVHGFRADVAKDVPLEFWRELRAAMDKVNPSAIILGEIWADGAVISRFLDGTAIDAAFHFPAFHALSGHQDRNGDGIINGMGSAAPLGAAIRALRRTIAPTTFMAHFTHNHDTNRLMSMVEGNVQLARAAAVWLYTAPDVPTIYYGEEIGMKGVKGAGNPYFDEFRREPLDWYAAETGKGMTRWFKPANRNNAPNDGISVEEQESDPRSLLSLYRRLGKLRAENAALRTGNFAIPRSEDALYVLQRWSNDTLYLVAINFTTQPQIFNAARYHTAGNITFAPSSAEVVLLENGSGDFERGFNLKRGGFVILRLRLP